MACWAQPFSRFSPLPALSPALSWISLSWSFTEVNLWQLLCFLVFFFGRGIRLMQWCHPSASSSQPPPQSLELLKAHVDFHRGFNRAAVSTSSSCSCHQNWWQQQREAGLEGASRKAPGGLPGHIQLRADPRLCPALGCWSGWDGEVPRKKWVGVGRSYRSLQICEQSNFAVFAC